MRLKDEHKDLAIRETALRMIVEEGFKGLSMQKLAKAANVSPATIYLYYEDRQDLLNKLYLEILDRTNKAALAGFDPEMKFDEGLRQIWQNRFRYYARHPYDFYFIEQFINSPLIKHVADKEDKRYGEIMQQFYKNAVKNKTIPELPVEIYWTVAFAPLYQLIKFHLQKNIHPQPSMTVTEKKLLTALSLIIKALRR